MKPFLILQLRPETEASDNEFQAILAKGGLTPDQAHRIRLDNNDIPADLSLDAYAGIIVGGGPGCISDPADRKSTIESRIEAAVISLMPEITARDVPFMGCCYGIGILAHHLGAPVNKRLEEPLRAHLLCHRRCKLEFQINILGTSDGRPLSKWGLAEVNSIKRYNLIKIDMIARAFISADESSSISVADVGCYNRPIWNFVKKIKENVEYLGVDEDPTALEYLKNHGLAGTNTEGYRQGQNYDFAFGLEVIEHIRQEKSIDFLSDIRNKTNKAFFLTTPNFEGWDGKGYSQVSQRPEYARMRYMPDHLRSFQATSENPHHHKQIMTAKGLQSQLEEALCPDNWSWCVIKAWPWLLTDLGSGKCYMHFFKLHAVAWRRAQFKNDMRLCLQEICENNPVFAAADDQEARNGN